MLLFDRQKPHHEAHRIRLSSRQVAASSALMVYADNCPQGAPSSFRNHLSDCVSELADLPPGSLVGPSPLKQAPADEVSPPPEDPEWKAPRGP
mmetsp:Transcript_66165/g.109602  ORF Transcript_66165/g.109602 Transcript_66165/m.109602 type:complete len:93 (+) Transcript_66165:83-361(+)